MSGGESIEPDLQTNGHHQQKSSSHLLAPQYRSLGEEIEISILPSSYKNLAIPFGVDT